MIKIFEEYNQDKFWVDGKIDKDKLKEEIESIKGSGFIDTTYTYKFLFEGFVDPINFVKTETGYYVNNLNEATFESLNKQRFLSLILELLGRPEKWMGLLKVHNLGSEKILVKNFPTLIEGNFEITEQSGNRIFSELPIEEVTGTVLISGSKYDTGNGLPKKIGNSLIIQSDSFRSFSEKPETFTVGGSIDVSGNMVQTLETFPKVINGNLVLSHNPLLTLWSGPEEVKGNLIIARTYLDSDLTDMKVDGKKIIMSTLKNSSRNSFRINALAQFLDKLPEQNFNSYINYLGKLDSESFIQMNKEIISKHDNIKNKMSAKSKEFIDKADDFKDFGVF